jgi:signal transduction histidine kinase
MEAVPGRFLPGARKKMHTRAAASATRKTLSRAFVQFTEAASSLEKSYGQLQAEVYRLRSELEEKNRHLSSSLEENARIRQYLTRILENLPCGVLVLGPAGELRMANAEAQRLVGVWEPGRDGKSATQETGERYEQLLCRLDTEGSAGCERELAWETPQGMRLLGVACAVLPDAEGNSSERAWLLRDITEARRLAEAAEAAHRRDSLAQMATLLAHEIRNPLGSLELFAGLLSDAASGQPDLHRWTDQIQAGLRQLSATVNNVLQFHSQAPPQLQATNLGRLLREAAQFLRPLARQMELRIDLINTLGEITLPLDPHRLQQVIFNLALNAFRSMSRGGTFTMRLGWVPGQEGEAVQIAFEDEGAGIAPEILPRILQPGFTTKAGNPGLGLAVCQSVVQQHRGTLQVASVPRKGTTVTVTLPYAGGAE